MDLYILSRRSLISTPGWNIVYALEDLLLKIHGGQLLIPDARLALRWIYHQVPIAEPLANRVLRRSIGRYSRMSLPSLPPGSVLLLMGLAGNALDLLQSVPDWRQRFDRVVAYIFDAWDLASYPPEALQLDHLFVPMPEIIADLHRHFQIPVSLVPFGSDVFTHGSARGHRPIDILSYGRTPKAFHATFADLFNQPTSDIFYHRPESPARQVFPAKPYEQRQDWASSLVLYDLLRRSKMLLTFDTQFQSERWFPHSFLTLRWFEGAGAGCVLVGKRPTTPLADELLNWPEATIELPDSPSESVSVIEALLADPDRLSRIRQRNHYHALRDHDWRWRFKQLWTDLDLPVPSALTVTLDQLTRRVEQLSYAAT